MRDFGRALTEDRCKVGRSQAGSGWNGGVCAIGIRWTNIDGGAEIRTRPRIKWPGCAGWNDRRAESNERNWLFLRGRGARGTRRDRQCGGLGVCRWWRLRCVNVGEVCSDLLREGWLT